MEFCLNLITTLLFILILIGIPILIFNSYGRKEFEHNKKLKKTIILLSMFSAVLACKWQTCRFFVAFLILVLILKLIWRSVLGGIVFVVCSFILLILTMSFSSSIALFIERYFGNFKLIDAFMQCSLLYLMLIAIVHLFFSIVIISKRKQQSNSLVDESKKKLRKLEKKTIYIGSIVYGIFALIYFYSILFHKV